MEQLNIKGYASAINSINSNDEGKLCVLCCCKINIFAFGICEHYICYKCSARLRVICKTTECPICRGDMPLIAFTWQRVTYSHVSKFQMQNKVNKIVFEDATIKNFFIELLENKCKLCQEKFHTFEELKVHLRQVHKNYFCKLCVENLSQFPFERKHYSNIELARHQRVGDPEEVSYKGHPLCEFCDERYFDKDELYKHLRKEHFHCHFCDSRGDEKFYKDQDQLKVHFRKNHFLCEKGKCLDEVLTSAFRSEVDLEIHNASHHAINETSSSNITFAKAVGFEFNFSYHQNSHLNANTTEQCRQHENRNFTVENRFRDYDQKGHDYNTVGFHFETSVKNNKEFPPLSMKPCNTTENSNRDWSLNDIDSKTSVHTLQSSSQNISNECANNLDYVSKFRKVHKTYSNWEGEFPGLPSRANRESENCLPPSTLSANHVDTTGATQFVKIKRKSKVTKQREVAVKKTGYQIRDFPNVTNCIDINNKVKKKNNVQDKKNDIKEELCLANYFKKTRHLDDKQPEMPWSSDFKYKMEDFPSLNTAQNPHKGNQHFKQNRT